MKLTKSNTRMTDAEIIEFVVNCVIRLDDYYISINKYNSSTVRWIDINNYCILETKIISDNNRIQTFKDCIEEASRLNDLISEGLSYQSLLDNLDNFHTKIIKRNYVDPLYNCNEDYFGIAKKRE